MQGKGLEHPVNRRFGQAIGFGGPPNAPMSSGRRFGFQRTPQKRCHLPVGESTRASRTKFVVKTLGAMLDESLPPLTHRGLGPSQVHAHLGVRKPFSSPQHQLGLRYQRMRKAARNRKPNQLLARFGCQFNRSLGTSDRHTQAQLHTHCIASYLWDTTLECRRASRIPFRPFGFLPFRPKLSSGIFQ